MTGLLPILVFVSAVALPQLPREGDSKLTLWYRQPAANWNEALPIGNGHLGGMVFGKPNEEHIQLNEDTLWEGKPSDRVNPKALESLPKVRQLIFDGKNEEASKLAGETMMGVPDTVESYQTLGDLHITFRGLGPTAEYRRWLDIESAIAGVSYSAAGVTYNRQIFASPADDVIVVRLTASQEGRLSFHLALDRPGNFKTEEVGDDTLHMSGRAGDDGVLYDALLKVRTEGGNIRAARTGLNVEDATTVTVYLTSKTNYNLKDPKSPLTRDRLGACQTTLDKAIGKSFANLVHDHIKEHQRLFHRVSLDLGHTPQDALPTDERLKAVASGQPDPALEALYFQFGRYLMISSSRPGHMPANLQGLWCDDMKAPWNADFHTNINLQMNYWPVEITNLAECHLPLIDLMDELVKPGEDTAKRMYGAGGWVVHHLTDPWGFTVPADGVWGIWPVGAAWLAQDPWEHYQFTQDKGFLKQRGYPLMRGAAEFLLDFLVVAPGNSPVAGKLVTNPSHSPENTFRLPDGTTSSFTYASSMDLEIAHDLFTNCLSAIALLGKDSPGFDSAFESRLKDALARLAPLQISKRTGRLQEWIEDYDEPEPGHRHMSHLFGLHPGHQITLEGTPELAAAARRSLEYRLSHGGGHTGWSRAWIVNFWARFREGDIAHENLTALLGKSTQPNMFDSHPPFQIDGNFGGCAGIAEMLLQSSPVTASSPAKVRILPAWPKTWQEGRVRGLRARGGFEVSIKWSNSELSDVWISSQVAGNPEVSVQLPSQSGVTSTDVTVHLRRGKTAHLRFKAGRYAG